MKWFRRRRAEDVLAFDRAMEEGQRAHNEGRVQSSISMTHVPGDTAGRQAVVNRALSARTVKDCDAALSAIERYVEDTGDETVLIYGSGVIRMRDAIRLVEAGLGDETNPKRRTLSDESEEPR